MAGKISSMHSLRDNHIWACLLHKVNFQTARCRYFMIYMNNRRLAITGTGWAQRGVRPLQSPPSSPCD